MLKKKRIFLIIALVVLAAIIGSIVFFSTHISIGGKFFSRNAQARIVRSVPFQEDRLSEDTQHIKISSLTKEEAETLSHLPALQYVEADDCKDYEALMYLQQLKPECEILYYVSLGDESFSSLSKTLSVRDVTAEQLEEALPLLPRLEHLVLSGKLPKQEELLSIHTAYPQVKLLCTLELWGQKLHTDSRKLDLSEADVDLRQLARMLPLFPDVTEVILGKAPLSLSQYQTLAEENPEISFVCDLEINGNVYSTDATEIDISGYATTVQEVESLIPLFPKLEKLIMSHCGIADETMDQLNRRYENIRIVWTLQIGLVELRTDALTFFPAAIDQHDLPSNEELQKLRYCTDMVAIDIGHSEATDCSWLEYMPHVKYLILADTQITDISPLANLKELIYAEIFSLDIDDYTPLLECTALQDLNIGSTFADPEPLKQMTWLHNLLWHNAQDHPVIGDQAQEVKEALHDTNVVLKTRRKNIGSIWRFLPNYYVFRELLGAGFFNQEAIYNHWEYKDGKRILACHNNDKKFAGDALVDIVRHNIDNNLPIMGVKNVGSEKADILYQSLLEAQILHQQILGATE